MYVLFHRGTFKNQWLYYNTVRYFNTVYEQYEQQNIQQNKYISCNVYQIGGISIIFKTYTD